ncbi:MAG: hypothetical protein ACKO5W_02205 [Crocinitomicaceae bacterium]
MEKNNINIRQFAPKKQGPGYLLRFVIYAIVLGALLWLICDRLNEVNNDTPKVLKEEKKSLTPQIEIE